MSNNPTWILQKGEQIHFMDYTIKNSLNNDGLVLSKENNDMDYESHLGNYGEGTKENIDFCKKDALLHFMVARPADFAITVVRKLRKMNSGTFHEYFILENVCKRENIELPLEVSCGDGENSMIYFNNEPLTSKGIDV